MFSKSSRKTVCKIKFVQDYIYFIKMLHFLQFLILLEYFKSANYRNKSSSLTILYIMQFRIQSFMIHAVKLNFLLLGTMLISFASLLSIYIT